MDGLEWNDLRLILAIGRTGSLSGAATELKNDHSTIFRKLKAIEKRTGVRFFERRNGHYEITKAGEAALGVAESFELDVLGLERKLVGRDARLEGNIRVSAAEGPAATFLPNVLARFQRRHPRVTLELISEFGHSDLNRRETDIALRITKSPPDSSVGRYICDFAFCSYASPAYLDRAGSRSLADHDWVTFEPTKRWFVPTVFSSEKALDDRTVMSTNSVQSAVAAAKAGVGALTMSAFLVERDAELIKIAGPYEEMTLQLWVLTHSDLRETARVTALMDHIARELRNDRALFEGNERSP